MSLPRRAKIIMDAAPRPLRWARQQAASHVFAPPGEPIADMLGRCGRLPGRNAGKVTLLLVPPRRRAVYRKERPAEFVPIVFREAGFEFRVMASPRSPESARLSPPRPLDRVNYRHYLHHQEAQSLFLYTSVY